MRLFLFKDDDQGTNILIEYILSITITAILFTMLLLMLNNTISTTNQMVMNEELGIIAGDISSRLSAASSEIYMNRYSDANYTSTVSDYTTTVDLPMLSQGEAYMVDLKFFDANQTGYVTVSAYSSGAASKTAAFHSNITVQDSTFICNGNTGIIHYDSSGINLTGY